ncbi:unnamed protein product [Caenorhabditis sp. 36 PRJEB53466]|nr:unnamed protein product [Caenorhabditis sp. 36 PRJEB53466]
MLRASFDDRNFARRRYGTVWICLNSSTLTVPPIFQELKREHLEAVFDVTSKFRCIRYPQFGNHMVRVVVRAVPSEFELFKMTYRGPREFLVLHWKSLDNRQVRKWSEMRHRLLAEQESQVSQNWIMIAEDLEEDEGFDED